MFVYFCLFYNFFFFFFFSFLLHLLFLFIFHLLLSAIFFLYDLLFFRSMKKCLTKSFCKANDIFFFFFFFFFFFPDSTGWWKRGLGCSLSVLVSSFFFILFYFILAFQKNPITSFLCDKETLLTNGFKIMLLLSPTTLGEGGALFNVISLFVHPYFLYVFA